VSSGRPWPLLLWSHLAYLHGTFHCGFWSTVAFYFLSTCLHGTFHCGLIVTFGRLWRSIFCVTFFKKSTLLSVTQKINATIDQKPQLGHNEMCHVNRLWLKKATLLSVTQKIKATIDQKPQLGRDEM